MNSILIALGIGVIAGIIDVIPMLFQRLDKYSCLSAFIHWVALGLIIPYVSWGIQPWIKGFLIAELTAIPIMLLVYPQAPKSIIPMFVFSAIIGSVVSIAGEIYVV